MASVSPAINYSTSRSEHTLVRTHTTKAQPLQPTAMPYGSAPALPAMQFIATYANNRLTLTLVPTVPYAHPIALKSAIPLLASVNVYKSTSFKKIGAASPQRPH